MKPTPLPKNIRIFSDTTSVSRGDTITLCSIGAIDESNIVCSWVFLSAFLRDRKLTDNQAKQLALLEVCRQDDKPVRLDIIERLIGYIGKADKELAKERIKKLIKWDKKQA